MVRPTKSRRVCELPKNTLFAPCPRGKAPTVTLAIEEYEVIRLIDHLGLTQVECAVQMNVARTTVQAIYDSARSKLAEVLVCGKQLAIGGGNYDLCAHATKCCGKSCDRKKCSGSRCAGQQSKICACDCPSNSESH